MPRKPTACLYVRRSSDKQDDSIERQQEMRSEAEQLYEIVDTYTETDSGWKENRKAFTRMMRDAKNGRFDCIYCFSQDRFSRFDMLTLAKYMYDLREAGVTVHCHHGGLMEMDSLAGYITKSVEQHGHRQYVESQSKHIRSGMRMLAEEGKWVQGEPPLGYRTDKEKRLVLGPAEEVETVRWIFQLALEGHGLRSISGHLNEAGIKTPKGQAWAPSPIGKLLRRRVYTGTYVYGQKNYAEFSDSQKAIVITGNHPAIIDEKTFNRVQKALSRRSKTPTPKPNGGDFVLTGKLVCHGCGSNLVGISKSNGLSYRCWKQAESGAIGCDAGTIIYQREAVPAILAAVKEHFTNEDVIAETRACLLEEHQDIDAEQLNEELNQCRAEIKRLERRFLQVSPDMIGIVENAIREQQNRAAYIAQRLESFQTPEQVEAAIARTVEAAVRAFDDLDEMWQEGDYQQLRAALSELVESISVEVLERPFTRSRRGMKIKLRIQLDVQSCDQSRTVSDETEHLTHIEYIITLAA